MMSEKSAYSASCNGKSVSEDAESVCFTSHRHTFQGSKRLPKHIRGYYKQQNALIDAYEAIQNRTDEVADDQKTAKIVSFWSKVTFAVNLALLIAKAVAAVLSRSLVVISSLLDSAMDLVSGALMWWSNRQIKNTNHYFYPRGRRKLEPVAIVILSVIMSCVSFQMIHESIHKIVIYTTVSFADQLVSVDTWLRDARSAAVSATNASIPFSCSGQAHNDSECAVVDTTVNLSSTIDLVSQLEISVTNYARLSSAPVFAMPTISICVITIVTKMILYLICRGIKNHSVQALAKDHFNDVISNTGAVLCGIIGYRLWKYADPIGAIIISFSIVINWSITARNQIKMVTGYTADPDFLKQITWIALRHDDRIRGLDRVIAFHFGSRYMVEVDIVLPPNMNIRDARNLGESLRVKIERLAKVERALVHTEYECKWLDNFTTVTSSVPDTDSSSSASASAVVMETEELISGHAIGTTVAC